ncbi:Wzz/FepE/Etk N-terminal domain-containing protein [Azospirillum thermophilum]|uniref:Polysaccharide chain length determinant N-terminal domain-containing protein n=1 Tax=Azospirillum thermophilum TaxID=2202148 RepID=A0A2S2CUP0_9PROT|nr:Wzz/FepE/Etk N-terminal domain-containing protein [Azospirillum thermophilum]AWK87997.1 hypothetical protein DEW08_12650 [Azospirillum thermophilum]
MPDTRLSFIGPPPAADLDLHELVRTLREGWRLVLACGLAGLLLALAGIWLVPPEFTATMVVGPTARVGAAAMGARTPVPAGREAAQSVAEPGPGEELLSDFARYLELFGSTAVAERLMADPGLLRAVYPGRWDEEAQRWRPAPGLGGMVKRLLLALVGREDWEEPDADRFARWLRSRIAVDMVRSGPMRRITLRHRDRAFALDLLGRVAVATDAHLRAEAQRRSAAQIAHVRSRLAAVTVTEHRRALADLLADQERLAMMIEVELPFAADLIDPPHAARLPDWPDPTVIVPLSAAAGLVAGGFLLAVRGVWRREGIRQGGTGRGGGP